MTAEEAIVATHEALIENLNNGNVSGIAELYAEDASILPPNAPLIEGREGIRGYWQAAIDMGIGDGAVTSLEVEDFGDWATQVGGFAATVPGEDGQRAPVSGKYIVIWKRDDDGTWRFYRDKWNFDA